MNATIWVAYNTDGDVETSNEDGATALQSLIENYGACEGVRVIEMALTLPEIRPVKIAATIPDTDGPVSVSITQD